MKVGDLVRKHHGCKYDWIRDEGIEGKVHPDKTLMSFMSGAWWDKHASM